MQLLFKTALELIVSYTTDENNLWWSRSSLQQWQSSAVNISHNTYSDGDELRHSDADLNLESEQRVHSLDLQLVDKLLV